MSGIGFSGRSPAIGGIPSAFSFASMSAAAPPWTMRYTRANAFRNHAVWWPGFTAPPFVYAQ